MRIYDMRDTWNDSGEVFTAIKMNVTDSASDASSLLMDLQVGGTSKFSVTKNGFMKLDSLQLDTFSYVNLDEARVTCRTLGGIGYIYAGDGGITIGRGGVLSFHSSGSGNAAPGGVNGDTFLRGDASNTLAQRSGANPQSFRIYNTYTDASNYERGFIKWDSNVLKIGTESAGTGVGRELYLDATSVRFVGGGNISNTQGQNQCEVFGNLASVGSAIRSVAFGYNATVGGTAGGGIAIGYNAYAASSTTTGGVTVAIGGTATSKDSVAIGGTTSTLGVVAIGRGAVASNGVYATTVIGYLASSAYAAVVLGGKSSATANNQFVCGRTNQTQGIVINDVYFGAGVTNTSPASYTIHGTGGSGTDINGADVSIAGGRSTGAGIGGNVDIKVSNSGASGTSLNNLRTIASFTPSGTTFSEAVSFNPVWDDGGAGTTYTALSLDVTDTSSAADSKLLDLKVGGATVFSVAKNGSMAGLPQEITLAITDEGTDLVTGTGQLTFRMPYAMTLTEVRANVNTAPVGADIIVDINEGGTSVLSTKLSIDAGEKTSTTATTAAVISDSALADDAEITIDVDQIGSTTAGKGLKVTLIGTRA